MSQLTYTTSKSATDLFGIIELQKNNLPTNLTKEEISSQGFVTVIHSLPQLEKMNSIEQHVICKAGDKVIAYLLAMTKECKNDLPILVPMFKMFYEIPYGRKMLSGCNYIVVGQVCVDKPYRGLGVLDRCYQEYKYIFSKKYDCAITEIAATNLRSLNAHRRIGFNEIHRYKGPDNIEWSIVIWDWQDVAPNL
jgi:hypothetical protein